MVVQIGCPKSITKNVCETVIQSVQWSIAIPFPAVFQTFLRLLSLLSLDFLSPQCFTGTNSFYVTTLVWSLGPVALAVANLALFAGRGALDALLGRGTATRARLTRQHFGFFLILSVLVLPPVSLKQFQALDCIPVAGATYVRINTAVNVRII